MFELFLSIGHYCADLERYTPLVVALEGLTPRQLAGLASNVEAANINTAPIRIVRSYVGLI